MFTKGQRKSNHKRGVGLRKTLGEQDNKTEQCSNYYFVTVANNQTKEYQLILRAKAIHITKHIIISDIHIEKMY